MSECVRGGMDRREFLQRSVASAAMLLAARSGLASGLGGDGAGTTTGTTAKRYGALEELAPGAVEPQGWLRVYLGKQAAELGSQLPEVSWPFTETYWAGLEQGESWWPWEQKAYWVDGATRLGLVMQDEALLKKVQATIDYTLSHPRKNGYLGPAFFEDPVGNEHRWPQNVFFRSLMASADAKTGPDGIAEAMRTHYLGDDANYSVPERNITNVEEMLWCYERTGDARLLEKAEVAWAGYLKKAATEKGGDFGDLSELRVYAATPINAHGVTYAEISKLPAILYLYTGKPEYLRFAEAAQRRIFDHHMLVDGVPSTSEWFRTRTSLDSHETCDIADHTWSWGYMLQASGDGVWGDRIERACFNAGPGAIRNDWKALQYFSCPNQFLATLDSDHNVMEHGGYMMAFQPNPGKATACCGGNVHRVFPNYVARMWMRGADGSLWATMYGPSTVRTVAGRERVPVVMEQTTSYPFDETITMRMAGERAVRFPLRLRVPGWCAAPELEVNGKRMTAQAQKGFVTVDREWRPGDTVVMTLPMRVGMTRWPQDGVAVERGPLVYALPIREQWTPVVEARYSTAAFPSYNALPGSDWNYGLMVREAELEKRVRVERGAMSDDPWTTPPLTLKIPARRVSGYELQVNPDKPAQRFTPPLPVVTAETVSGPTEEIALVPYGSTQLRATIFPDVSGVA